MRPAGPGRTARRPGGAHRPGRRGRVYYDGDDEEPIVARARVQEFRQIGRYTPDALRETTRGFRLFDLDDYWASRHPVFFGMTIYLEDEAWLDDPIQPAARGHGESWIVLEAPETRAKWLNPGPVKHRDPAPGSKKRGGSRTIRPSRCFQVLRRDDFACTYCGRRPPEVKLHVDHVIPWSKGGPTLLENLRVACSDCNLGKGSNSL